MSRLADAVNGEPPLGVRSEANEPVVLMPAGNRLVAVPTDNRTFEGFALSDETCARDIADDKQTRAGDRLTLIVENSPGNSQPALQPNDNTFGLCRAGFGGSERTDSGT